MRAHSNPFIHGHHVLDQVLDVVLLPAICQFDVPTEHATDIIPCGRPTPCYLQGVLANYHLVELLLRCSRHSPIVLQYELPRIAGCPLRLLLLRDRIYVDWHTQWHQPPLFVVIGPLANIICNLQEDGMSLLFWRDHQQAALVGAHRKSQRC